MSSKDLLGRDLTEVETEILDLYERLKALSARPDLAPCIAANARFATATLWQVVTDLDLVFEQLYDQGV